MSKRLFDIFDGKYSPQAAKSENGQMSTYRKKGSISMSYYNKCPHCGAALDPGEKCDCQAAPADIAARRQAIKECIDHALNGADLHEMQIIWQFVSKYCG